MRAPRCRRRRHRHRRYRRAAKRRAIGCRTRYPGSSGAAAGDRTPPRRHRHGPARRNPRVRNVCSRSVEVFVTSRAAWISSFSTTSTPMPRASGTAATRIALTRFMPGIGRQRAGRPLRADQHHRHRDLQRQIEEIRGLLQRRGAVADDDAGEIGMLGDKLVAQQRPTPSSRRNRSRCWGYSGTARECTSATSAVSGHRATISSACITLPDGAVVLQVERPDAQLRRWCRRCR